MEEVDDALLRCVEEGSGHGVVLSISTEKLRRKKEGQKWQIWAALQQGRLPDSGERVSARQQLWAASTPTLLGSPALPTVEGIDWEVQ